MQDKQPEPPARDDTEPGGAKPHPVDQAVQEKAAEEREESGGYD